MTRSDMQKKLKGMLVSELDELIDTLHVPVEYLTQPAAPASRSIEIIRYLEAHERLNDLEQYLQSPSSKPRSQTGSSAHEITHSLNQPKKQKAFICYSHKDSRWLQRLQVHLEPLKRDGLLDIWDDTRLLPGMNSRSTIEQALNQASIAVILVSADFLASDFIVKFELPILLDAARQRGLHILPLIVAPSLFSEDPLISKYHPINPIDRPLKAMRKSETEETLVRLARAMAEYVRRP